MPGRCLFCYPQNLNPVVETELSYALRDLYPVSPGHSLIIPRRHIESLALATADEVSDLFQLLQRVREGLDADFGADAYNVGINDGAAAGQTVPHLHIHLIPRYRGDRPEVRGGVRWIFPDKAAYWR